MGNEYRDVYGVKGFMPHPMSLVEIENKTEEGKGGGITLFLSVLPLVIHMLNSYLLLWDDTWGALEVTRLR